MAYEIKNKAEELWRLVSDFNPAKMSTWDTLWKQDQWDNVSWNELQMSNRVKMISDAV